MEEVDGSNPSRSTKTFQTLTVPLPTKNVITGVQLDADGSLYAWATGQRVARLESAGLQHP
jgi:hypothetical protein